MKFKSLVLATVIGAVAVSGCGILNEKKQNTHVHTIDCTIENIKDAHPDFKLEEKVPVIQYSHLLQAPHRLLTEDELEIEGKHFMTENYFVIVSGFGTKSLVYRCDYRTMGAPIIDTSFEPNSTAEYSALDYNLTKVLGIYLNTSQTKLALPIVGTYRDGDKEKLVIKPDGIMHDLYEDKTFAFIQNGANFSEDLRNTTLLSFGVNKYENGPVKLPYETYSDHYIPYNQYRKVNLNILYASLSKSKKVYMPNMLIATKQHPIKDLIQQYDYEINYFIQPKDYKEINVLKYISRDKDNLTFELVTINKEGKKSQNVTVKNKNNQTFICNGITFKLNRADLGKKKGNNVGVLISLMSTKDYKLNSQIQTTNSMLSNSKELLKYYGVSL